MNLENISSEIGKLKGLIDGARRQIEDHKADIEKFEAMLGGLQNLLSQAPAPEAPKDTPAPAA